VRFGSLSGLAIEVEPLDPGWDRRSRNERGPWARFSLYAGERCLTEVVDEGSDRVRGWVAVPLRPLADWFVRSARAILVEESSRVGRTDVELHKSLDSWNDRDPIAGSSAEAWEEERYAWYGRHFLPAGAEGALVPDVAFVKSDDRLWVSWRPPVVAGGRRPRFLAAPGVRSFLFEDAWSSIGDFVEFVAREIPRAGLVPEGWERESRPLEAAGKATIAEFVDLAVPDALQLLQRMQVDESRSASECVAIQALRDLEVVSSPGLETALLTLEEGTRSGPGCALGEERALILQSGTSCTHEEQGKDAARWKRHRLGLDGDPLSTVELIRHVENLAHIEKSAAGGESNRTAVGARKDGSAVVVLFDGERMRHDWVRRMELARAAGHLLLDGMTPAGALGAGSSRMSSGPRRRRSGAFAAEFLMPESGVRKLLGGRAASEPACFKELMSVFGIGARTAAYHLWNAGILESPEVRDELIDRYGGVAGW